MSTINIDLGEATQLNVLVGQQDENEVQSVVFDFSDWYTAYGSGTLSLSIQRSKDEWPYAGELTIDSANHTGTWEISDTDSAYAGVGQIQLSYTVDTAVKKSVIYRFTVYRSLGANGNVITPVQIQDFIDEVEDALEDIEADIADIKQDLGDLTDLETTVKTDLVSAINEVASGVGGSGLTSDIKTALLQLASKVAYIDDDGNDYYQDLYDALYPPAPPATLSSISCVYTQGGTVYTTDSLDSLKTDLVVTAHYSDNTSSAVASANYTLSGTLTAGTSTITVSYGGKTTTFTVTVTQGALYPLETGEKTFSNDRKVSVYDGNVVKGELTNSASNDIKANVSQVSLNSSTSNDDNNNKVATAKLFTIPSGASVSISVTPLTVTYQDSTIGAKQMNIAMRDQTGTNLHHLLNTVKYNELVVNMPVTDSFTADSDLDVWNITLWMSASSTKTCTVELEIELTVNGTRFI